VSTINTGSRHSGCVDSSHYVTVLRRLASRSASSHSTVFLCAYLSTREQQLPQAWLTTARVILGVGLFREVEVEVFPGKTVSGTFTPRNGSRKFTSLIREFSL
jgi:hypothetical protein